MDIGLKISLSGHALFIAAMLIAGPLFDAEAEDALKVTSVSLISGDELSQLEEGAAFLPPEPTPEPIIEPEPEPETPPKPEPENQSDLGLAAQEENSGELSEELPEEDLTTQTRQSDRVAPIEVEEAPELTTSEQELEPEAEPEIIPEDTPPSPTEAEEAPILDQPEATSEISPDSPRPETESPVKTARPKARPDDLTPPEPEPEPEVEEPEPEPTPEPEPEPTPEESEPEETEAEPAPAPTPQTEENEPQRLGSRLSQAERSEVILAVERCWNPPAGVENAEDLRVTLGMDMDRNGAPRGQPVLLSPTGAGISNLHQRAFEAARRAIIRCAPFPLPADKYETWKRIEMTFNPKDLVLH